MNEGKQEVLGSVLRTALQGRIDEAQALLGTVVDEPAGGVGDPQELRNYIFAAALARRLDSTCSAEINLYLQQYELPQISLFNLLAEHLPTVSLAGEVSNRLLCRFLAGHEEVALLDVGIGTGRQEAMVLRELAAQGALPGKLTVFAVEPDPRSLQEAHETLLRTAREVGLRIDVLPVRGIAEELTDEHWRLFGSARGPLVVHSAFAAHHIRDRGDGYCARSEFFRRLRRLDPLAVVLCEPSSDHHTHLPGERFENCWRHFGLTFDLIDRSGSSPEEAAAMKMFFAREIQDILGNVEDARCERHESVGAWVDRLRKAGFTPYTDFGAAGEIRHPLVEVRAREGYVGLDYGDETLVSVVCATSAKHPALARDTSPFLQVA